MTAEENLSVVSALGSLRALLVTDGYDLAVVTASPGRLVLQINAGPGACADCLVQPAIMQIYVRDALKSLPSWREAAIELRYPNIP